MLAGMRRISLSKVLVYTAAAAGGAGGAFAAVGARGQSQPTVTAVTEDVTTVVPSFRTADALPKVELKPDLEATGFSCQNAFFFSKMSKIAYLPKNQARGLLKGTRATPGMGYDHFYWYEADKAVSGKSLFDAIHDTEAFVVANDDVILVVFRGTSELTDWMTNLKIRTRNIPKEWGLGEEDCDVHQGFDDGVNTVWGGQGGMHQRIKTLYEEKGKHRKLYIAGHSLGGALATVAAARLAFVDDLNIAGMYTIGSPRVFDRTLAARFDSKLNHGTPLKKKYFRCRNNNDIVPRIVPPPYCHVGTEIYLNRFGSVAATSWADRLLGRMSSYLRLSFVDGVNDHSGSEYVRLFKQLVVNSKMSFFDKTKSVVMDAAQKVMPVNKQKAKIQEAEIEAAKQAVLDASKETYHPTKLPDYPTEP